MCARHKDHRENEVVVWGALSVLSGQKWERSGRKVAGRAKEKEKVSYLGGHSAVLSRAILCKIENGAEATSSWDLELRMRTNGAATTAGAESEGLNLGNACGKHDFCRSPGLEGHQAMLL
nr:hypothetical protein CFP56_53610 [Quercus suber]